MQRFELVALVRFIISPAFVTNRDDRMSAYQIFENEILVATDQMEAFFALVVEFRTQIVAFDVGTQKMDDMEASFMKKLPDLHHSLLTAVQESVFTSKLKSRFDSVI